MPSSALLGISDHNHVRPFLSANAQEPDARAHQMLRVLVARLPAADRQSEGRQYGRYKCHKRMLMHHR